MKSHLKFIYKFPHQRQILGKKNKILFWGGGKIDFKLFTNKLALYCNYKISVGNFSFFPSFNHHIWKIYNVSSRIRLFSDEQQELVTRIYKRHLFFFQKYKFYSFEVPRKALPSKFVFPEETKAKIPCKLMCPSMPYINRIFEGPLSQMRNELWVALFPLYLLKKSRSSGSLIMTSFCFRFLP